MTSAKEAFAKGLRLEMKERKVTIVKLSQLSLVSAIAISKILRLERCPLLETADMLAKGLNLTLAKIIERGMEGETEENETVGCRS